MSDKLRLVKSKAWKREHDASCEDCKAWGAHHFGLDDAAMQQVKFASPLLACASSPVSRPAHRPRGDGKGARPRGILRPPSYPWGGGGSATAAGPLRGATERRRGGTPAGTR